MISGLTLRNFKAFEFLAINLRPLTFILGPNNSGKSSIISPIRMLVQTMESYDQEVPLLLDGIMGDFGTYKDIVFGNHRGRVLEMSIDFELDKRRIPGANSGHATIDLSFKYRTKRREVILKSVRTSLGGKQLVRLEYSNDSDRLHITSIGNRVVPSALKSSLSRGLQLQHFLPFAHLSLHQDSRSESASLFQDRKTFELRRKTNIVTSRLREAFSLIEYVGAMRVPPSRTYLFTGEKRRRVGASGENAASLFVMDVGRSGRQKVKLLERTSDWLKSAGLAERLDVVPLSDRHYELRLTHPITKEKQNLSDVGYGNSQVIPVLAGGFNLPAKSTYLVEEPEIHLHPSAQAELGNFFFELYNSDVQSIVETHSEHVILRLQQFVADRQIPPDDIVFYYVRPDPDGHKVVTQLRLDEQGKFIDEWPGGFFPQKLEEAKRLSQIRFKHSTKST
jgi:hypothetical protein